MGKERPVFLDPNPDPRFGYFHEAHRSQPFPLVSSWGPIPGSPACDGLVPGFQMHLQRVAVLKP